MNTEQKIRYRVRVFRAIREYTQKEAAEDTAIDAQTWSKIEAGSRSLTIADLDQLAAGLLMPPGTLMLSDADFSQVCAAAIKARMENDI
jgi:transcriptional regulator with XRE-family HTH domain